MNAPKDPGFGRSGGLVPPPTLSGRFGITDVVPNVEAGRRPVKAVEGEQISISATVFREGHDKLGADVLLRGPQGDELATPLTPVPDEIDRWNTLVRIPGLGDWSFTIRAWHDPLATWRERAEIKVPAGIDQELELLEGALLFDRFLAENPDLPPVDATQVFSVAASLRDTDLDPAIRLAAAVNSATTELLEQFPLRDYTSTSGQWPVRSERRRALYGSWYEFFPRSEGATQHPPQSGTFQQASERLDGIAEMGFDVVYLPPIHPVGEVNRKGRNNTLETKAGDPGSPWAIGSKDGGHDSIHPDLGTFEDFDRFVERTRELGMEVALDLALQTAPDHPWVAAHPSWFTTRADGSVAYAENPPKKYQDIYPLNFDNDPEGLYAEVVRVVRLWMSHGVRIFRVDNPHTKPLWVWDRLIGEINATDPDVIFLAEAFTLPPMMRALASVGFQQSYTYFTWRNRKHEITEYSQDLSGPQAAFMRPNFFVNTPDILHEYLQVSGPAGFAIRATLAATLSPTWGMYSGFELFEHAPIKRGSEEYLDTEKFQYRPRAWSAAANRGNTLIPYVTRLNHLRRDHPALQQLRNITFHHVEDDEIIAFSKRDGDDLVIVICTLDPFGSRETTMWLDMPALGLDWDAELQVEDGITGAKWTWHQQVFLRLNPFENVAHILRLTA